MTPLLLLALAVLQPPVPVATPLRVSSLAFSPDRARLAIVHGERNKPGKLIVRDTKTGTISWTLDQPVAVVQFSTDGSKLFVGASTLLVLDATSGKQLAECKHESNVTAIAVGPEDRFATAAGDRIVRVWDGKTFAELIKTQSIREAISGLSFSTDGNRLAGTHQSVIQLPDRKTTISSYLWNAHTGQELRTFDDSSFAIAGVAFSQDGSFLIRCILNTGELTIHDAVTGEEISRLGSRSGIDRFAFSPHAGLAVTSGSFEVILTLYSFRFEKPTTNEKVRIQSLIAQFDSDAVADREAAAKSLFEFGFVAEPFLKQAMTDSPSAEIRLRTRKALIEWRSKGYKRIKLASSRTTALAISPDGSQVAWGVADGTVRIINLKSEKVDREWKP